MKKLFYKKKVVGSGKPVIAGNERFDLDNQINKVAPPIMWPFVNTNNLVFIRDHFLL